jgi:chitinase
VPPMINVGSSGPLIGRAPLNTALPVYAYDLDGSIANVKIYRNGVYVADAVKDPATKVYWYTTASPLAAGKYSFTAVATDNLGATVTSSVTKVDVNPANTLPSVSLTAPAMNATFTAPASITISGNSSDGDGTISKVQILSSGNILATYTTSTFSYNWTSVAAGDYTISARVTDNKGGISISTVLVKVNPAVVCTAPAWVSTTAYVAGNVVVYAGIKYQANWWTLNERPDLNWGVAGSGKPWAKLGNCTSRAAMINDSKSMELYPNPAQGMVNVQFESTEGGEVEILIADMVGHEVLSKALNTTSGTNDCNLDVSSLQAGIYVLTISNGNDKIVKQLVISK